MKQEPKITALKYSTKCRRNNKRNNIFQFISTVHFCLSVVQSTDFSVKLHHLVNHSAP